MRLIKLLFLFVFYLSNTAWPSAISGGGGVKAASALTSTGITQQWLAPTTDGAGGMVLSNATGNSYVCPQTSSFNNQFTCLQNVTGTGGQVILGGATHLWSGTALDFNISNGNFAGTNIFHVDSKSDMFTQGGWNTEFYNFWPGIAPGNQANFGFGFNLTALDVAPGATANIFQWTPDNIISMIQLHFVCQGGSSTASDYWLFDRIFQLNVTGISGNTHTGWAEISGGTGKAVIADTISAGLAGSALAMTFSGLTITATVHNASGSLTAHITCEIDDHNGHIQ